MLVYNKSLPGAVLYNVSEDFPISSPTFQLAPTGVDAATQFLWLPGLTCTTRDMSGNGNHLYSNFIASGYTPYGNIVCPQSGTSNSGVQLVAANKQIATWTYPSHTISVLNAITGDFTLEFRASWASTYTSSYRAIFDYGASSTHHFYAYIGGAAGGYTLYFTTTSSSSPRTASVALNAINNNQMYRFAITKRGGKIYFFQEGTLLNPGGTAFNYTIDSSTSLGFYLGCSAGYAFYWDGYIDEIRISNTARWTASYSPAALSYGYQTSGTIFTKVYYFGASNDLPSNVFLTDTIPSDDSVAAGVRAAASASDQTSTWAAFSAYPQWGIRGEWQQFAIGLTGNGTTSPSISGATVLSVSGFVPHKRSVWH
jgi:hypothetical protein